ncbi:hypothetical protein THAOC_05733, partial [Thalassiosira oceanica]
LAVLAAWLADPKSNTFMRPWLCSTGSSLISCLLVCRAAKRYGKPFKASRGVTQGGPLSPKIFNIMVDVIAREWIRHILLALLYADDVYIASTSRRVVQDSMDILTELFDRVGLRTNTEKTKVMTCVNEKYQKRSIATQQRGSTLKRRGESARDLVLDDHESITFTPPCKVPQARGIAPCPNTPDQCRRSGTCGGISVTATPLTDLVNVSGEGVLPRCPRCDMQTNFANSPNHELSKLCREGAERKAQYAAPAQNARALEVEFTAYGETLERVEVFKYLGRLMAMDNNTIMICAACGTNPSSDRFCFMAARPGRCVAIDDRSDSP